MLTQYERDIRAFFARQRINMFDKMKTKKVIRKIKRWLKNENVAVERLYDKLDKPPIAARRVRRKQNRLQIFQQRYEDISKSHLTQIERHDLKGEIVW